jgi:hypothetical protein
MPLRPVLYLVILNEVKNPLGQRKHSERNLTRFFATLRMTRGFENGYSIFETTLGRIVILSFL